MTEWVESICAYVPPYHHSIFLHTNSEKSSKCRLEPTQTPTTSKKLCRRHGPIWPKLERHGVSSATCRDMSATFPAKIWPSNKILPNKWSKWREDRNSLCQMILRKVAIPVGVDGQSYWEAMILGITNDKFCALRANFKQELFEQFQGKYAYDLY